MHRQSTLGIFMNGFLTAFRCPKMRDPTAIINPKPETLLFILKSFSSLASLPLDHLQDPHDLPSQLFSILSRPNWQKHPSLKKLIPSISPFHVSSLFSLDLDPHTALGFFYWIAEKKPGFNHNVHSHSSLLNILLRYGFLGPAEKIRISMIKSCQSVDDAYFVLDVLRIMNREKG